MSSFHYFLLSRIPGKLVFSRGEYLQGRFGGHGPMQISACQALVAGGASAEDAQATGSGVSSDARNQSNI